MRLIILRAAPLTAIATAFAFMTAYTADHPAHAHEHESYMIGQPGDPKKPTRVVKVTMQENRDGTMSFSPNSLVVTKGEQIRFEITNTGKSKHEFILDTIGHNAHHRIEMAKNPEMEHDEANMQTLQAGKSTEILWRFSKPGTFEFACLIPGHYEAGMQGTVTVK